jgi:NAD(P)-dependent dehydrogenase (short-subunit alcohol dehydrogenase family)
MAATPIASPLCRGHFDGRRVAVTSAARGIGYSIARGFAQSGAAVFLIDRDDYVKQAAEALRDDGFDAHATPPRPATSFNRSSWAWGNLTPTDGGNRRHVIYLAHPPRFPRAK